MMKEEPRVRPRRNKPCENCRMHRRKCVSYDNSTCERCHKLDLDCIFKITEKPNRPYKPAISTSKRNKLYEAIWTLEDETENIQLELSRLKNIANNECKCTDPNKCQAIQTLPSSSHTRWALTISSNQHGIHLQTNIRSMADLASFLQEAFGVFVNEGKFSINHSLSELDGRQVVPLTFQSLGYERMFRPLFSAVTATQVAQTTESLLDGFGPNVHRQIRSLKLSMIRIYFNCQGLVNPFLIHSYYYPLLCENPDSLLATAVVAMVAHSPCVHVNMSGFTFTRSQFAEICRLEAKEMLKETLFEAEPTLDTCLSLHILVFSSLHALKGVEGRFQASICWQMMTQLRSTYMDKRNIRTSEDIIKAEAFKRVYYLVRYIEVTLHMIYDNAKDFSHITQHPDVGLPSVLPCEASDDRLVNSVLAFQTVCRLIVSPSADLNEKEGSALRLMAGVVEAIPSNIIQQLERNLLSVWEATAPRVRLATSPYRLIDSAVVETCQDPCILRCNLNYYIYWMSLHSKVMEQPQETDLTGAAFGRIDGDRALIIVSICSDAITQIYKAMNALLPCAIEIHWITMCVDVLKLLSTSANIPIRKRAEQNHDVLSRVLYDKLRCMGDDSSYPFASQAPYLIHIKKAINGYMNTSKHNL
ncbi:uncharacterized protein B0P05DRAFT_600349 [Gilbertella persicaria]|uniref:uncharacterized protein n=1 Tax=Gilbertella persicaria TaxID=101096 RepID=UPI00221F2C68|nr:uncharacterized protein B0P05DRAFT_600349 [Gilbertella persicaria]KAI8053137.1 hypothetical protein B0P05DRAFT_600349 [Gilbertella persicaria]